MDMLYRFVLITCSDWIGDIYGYSIRLNKVQYTFMVRTHFI